MCRIFTDKQTSTVFAFSFGAESDLFPLRVAYEQINDAGRNRQNFKDWIVAIDILSS
jgi:hypothetical protein